MSAVRSRVPIERVPGTTALYGDYVAGRGTSLHGRLGGFVAGWDGWQRALAAHRKVDARVVARMVADNEALGASAATVERIRTLAHGARAVVTGQQPGVLGGPLLSLYKAATAVALAREIESRWGTPCVPVFWLGSDDDDFAEIREIAVASDSLALVAASLDTAAYQPGRAVGDIAGGAVVRTWESVRPFIPAGERAARIDAFARAGDLGRIAAATLVGLTEGTIAVIDGRERSLREAARALILDFFDREDEVRERVTRGGESLVADGYHAQVEMGKDSGLFLASDGTRRRVPPSERARAREAFAREPSAAAPGVVARNLIQDSVFAPTAVVLGPAEIAYRAQLAGVQDLLGVAQPVVFPRLSGTFVPPAMAEVLDRTGVDASLMITDPVSWGARVTQSLQSREVADAARAFEADFREQAERFVLRAGSQLDARAQEKLAKRMAELAARIAQAAQGAVEQDALARSAQWPWLARASELLARDGAAQERFLAAIVPYTFHGDASWRAILDVASEHVRDALDGRVVHRVYSV